MLNITLILLWIMACFISFQKNQRNYLSNFLNFFNRSSAEWTYFVQLRRTILTKSLMATRDQLHAIWKRNFEHLSVETVKKKTPYQALESKQSVQESSLTVCFDNISSSKCLGSITLASGDKWALSLNA